MVGFWSCLRLSSGLGAVLELVDRVCYARASARAPAVFLGSNGRRRVFELAGGAPIWAPSPKSRPATFCEAFWGCRCKCSNKCRKPASVEAALADPSWCATMEPEVMSILDNETWTPLSLLHGHQAIVMKWFFER
jgi:hypothetical protein